VSDPQKTIFVSPSQEPLNAQMGRKDERRLTVNYKITHRVGPCVLGLALVIMLVGMSGSDALGVDFGLYQVDFLGAAYDAGANATTFTYRVAAAIDYGFDDWTVELKPECFGTGVVLDAGEPYLYAWPAPATGIYGITFTTPYAPSEIRTVWFRLAGNLASTQIRVDIREGCSHWTKEMNGPDCPGQPTPPLPPPPSGQGKSPGYWKNQLGRFLGYDNGNLKEPDVGGYAAQYGYTAQAAYDILNYGGDDMVAKLHRQVVAAKLSTAAGYLSGVDELLEEGQYMVVHPGEFTFQQLEDAKDLFESLHD
jgi:hypothetical protein